MLTLLKGLHFVDGCEFTAGWQPCCVICTHLNHSISCFVCTGVCSRLLYIQWSFDNYADVNDVMLTLVFISVWLSTFSVYVFWVSWQEFYVVVPYRKLTNTHKYQTVLVYFHVLNKCHNSSCYTEWYMIEVSFMTYSIIQCSKYLIDQSLKLVPQYCCTALRCNGCCCLNVDMAVVIWSCCIIWTFYVDCHSMVIYIRTLDSQ